MVKTLIVTAGTLFFLLVQTLNRDTFNDNKMQIYHMLVEINVIQYHICTKATEQFYIFFSDKVTCLIFCFTMQLYVYAISLINNYL